MLNQMDHVRSNFLICKALTGKIKDQFVKFTDVFHHQCFTLYGRPEQLIDLIVNWIIGK